MKKGLLCLAGAILIGGLGLSTLAPVKDDKKPIVVDKMCYAEEIVEYEAVQPEIEITEDEQCEDCVCICVRGLSTSSITPDKATIFAVIENLDTDISKSKDLNYEIFDNVVSSLKGAGLEDQQICLDYFNCSPSYDYTNGRTLQGYMTSTAFNVKVDNLDNLKSYIDVMTENGVTSICNIEYQLSSMDEEYSNALSNAFENARMKAIKLLGNEDLKLIAIREEMVFSSNSLCKNYVEGVSSGLVGKIEIEARVLAEFESARSATAV